MRLFPALNGPADLHQRWDRHRDVWQGNFANNESGDGKRLRTQNAYASLAHILNAPLNLFGSGMGSAHRRHCAGAYIDCLGEPRMLPPVSLG